MQATMPPPDSKEPDRDAEPISITLARSEWERIARLLWEDTLKRQDAAQLIRLRMREHDDAERKRQRKVR